MARVRGGKAAQERVVELLGERLDTDRPLIVGLVHAKAPAWADRLRRRLAAVFTLSEVLLAEMGPVVGTHVGPGMVGVVAFQPTEPELDLLAPLG